MRQCIREAEAHIVIGFATLPPHGSGGLVVREHGIVGKDPKQSPSLISHLLPTPMLIGLVSLAVAAALARSRTI